VHADLFDEQAEEFLRLLGACVGEDLVELVCEAGATLERVHDEAIPRRRPIRLRATAPSPRCRGGSRNAWFGPLMASV
jgi:hypothetical protein